MTTLNPTLAKTSFESGVDETLATPDVYGGNAPKEPFGAVRDSINNTLGFAGDKGGLFGLGGGGLSDLLSTDMATFSDKFGNYEKGIKAVTAILNGDKSLIENLKTNMVGDLLKSAGFGETAIGIAGTLINGDDPMQAVGLLAKANPNMRLIMDGVETVVGAKDIDSVEDLLAVAGKISGMEGLGELLNIGPELGVINGLVDKANQLGIPALASALTKTIKNPEDRKKVELASTLGAAQGANLEMLEDIINRHGAEAVSGMYPLMVGQILSSYRFTTEDQHATLTEAQKLIEVCNKLEKDWLYETRNGKRLLSTRYLITLSKDAKELFYLLDETREAAMVGGKYPATTIMSLAQRQYPYTPMSFV